MNVTIRRHVQNVNLVTTKVIHHMEKEHFAELPVDYSFIRQRIMQVNLGHIPISLPILKIMTSKSVYK